MKIKLGFSTCPNDTFMFDALIHNRIDTEGITYEVHLADIFHLNQMAQNEELDMIKISYNTYGQILDRYQLLDSGSALGHNCGPLLISKDPISVSEIVEKNLPVAIPGKNTTAHLLLGYFAPEISNKKEYIFHEIMPAIESGEAAAGVIIHENRFTYQEKGLALIQDLGQYWETRTGSPIPLGGIAIRRGLDEHLKVMIQEQIANSVRYAWAHPQASADYIQCHAQEMDPRVTRQHIELYVNDYSADLGTLGRQAITKLYAEAVQSGILEEMPVDLFL